MFCFRFKYWKCRLEICVPDSIIHKTKFYSINFVYNFGDSFFRKEKNRCNEKNDKFVPLAQRKPEKPESKPGELILNGWKRFLAFRIQTLSWCVLNSRSQQNKIRWRADFVIHTTNLTKHEVSQYLIFYEIWGIFMIGQVSLPWTRG